MDQSTHQGFQTKSQMPILVTGGAGYLGVAVVNKLCAMNESVVALYRNKMPEPRPNLYPIAADLINKTSVESSIQGAHTVIHMAWEYTWRESKEGAEHSKNTKNNKNESTAKEFQDLRNFDKSPNVQVLKNILETMDANKVSRLVFVSAVGAARDAKDLFLREKYYCEQLIINSNIREKVIVRSAVLFGGQKEAGFIESAKKLMKSPIFYPVPKVESLMSPLHVEDLADLILKCSLVKMYDFCAVVDLVGGEPYKASQIFKIIAQKTNKNLFPISSFLGNFFMRILERNYPTNEPKILEYFSIGSRIEKKIRHKNPLSKLAPEKCKNFHEEYA